MEAPGRRKILDRGRPTNRGFFERPLAPFRFPRILPTFRPILALCGETRKMTPRFNHEFRRERGCPGPLTR